MSASDDRLLTLGLAGLGLAHELNTPLTTLGLRLELLAEQVRAGTLPPAAMAAQLDGAAAQVQRMGRLIDRFRRFARGEPGVAEVVTVDQVLDEAMHIVRPALAEAAVARIRVGARLPGLQILVDPLMLSQALSCLVFNASDIVGEGRATTVELSARLHDEDTVMLLVEDDGPGFADASSAAQAGWSSKGRGGMGVGLAFAAELAYRLGGRLELDNRAEGGARAALHLPVLRVA